MADIITVDNLVVSYVLEEEGVIALLDGNEQVMAILPEDNESVLVHMAVMGNTEESVYYDFDLNQQFLGVSKFEDVQ